MKKNSLLIILSFVTSIISAQELVQSYFYTDGYAMIPKMVLEREGDIVIPYSITKNNEKKAGVLYLNKDNSIKDAILLKGKNNYVINEIIESNNGNLLISAEGYSQQGQESLYFIELNNNGIVDEFIFNENGNELDPFSILEVDENILIGGFVKSRELVSNSFYNMYSETQMIYVGEFTKDGQKKWSKGIELEGYEKGICNQMIKVNDGIVMLCHANKLGEKMSSILIKLDPDFNIKSIVNISDSDFITVGGKIQILDNNIYLAGSLTGENESYLFTSSFNQSLGLIEVFEYQIAGSCIINEYKDGVIIGSLNKNGYNNLILEPETMTNFGNAKTNMLVGSVDNHYYGYTITNTLEQASTFDIFHKSNIDSAVPLAKNSNDQFIKIKSIDNYNIITDFLESSINKGVSKVRIEDVKSNIFQK